MLIQEKSCPMKYSFESRVDDRVYGRVVFDDSTRSHTALMETLFIRNKKNTFVQLCIYFWVKFDIFLLQSPCILNPGDGAYIYNAFWYGMVHRFPSFLISSFSWSVTSLVNGAYLLSCTITEINIRLPDMSAKIVDA